MSIYGILYYPILRADEMQHDDPANQNDVQSLLTNLGAAARVPREILVVFHEFPLQWLNIDTSSANATFSITTTTVNFYICTSSHLNDLKVSGPCPQPFEIITVEVLMIRFC